MLMITSGLENNLLTLDLAFKQFVTLPWLNFLKLKDASIVFSNKVYCLFLVVAC